MSDEPQGGSNPPEHRAAGEERGFLYTTKGIVTGITSLVVAMTGLVVACEKLAPADKPAGVQAAASTGGTTESANKAEAAQTPDESSPLLYTGDNTRLEWDDQQEHWTLTVGDASGGYEEVASDRDEDAVARQVGGNDYLRWPIAGGWLEVSQDGKQSWARVARITPTEPEQQQ